MVIVVWTAALSVIVFITLVVVTVERSNEPQLVRVGSFSVLPTGTYTVSSATGSQSRSLDQMQTFRQQQETGDDTAWLESLRDENWILYPATSTVISHHRTYAGNERSLRQLGLRDVT